MIVMKERAIMKTSFEEIVNVDEIGKQSGKNLHDILALAKRETVKPASEDQEKVLFLGIDIQNDFMEQGALGVPGAKQDIANATKFIYRNLEKITDIMVSLDTHEPMQIFHPAWWVDENGNHPEPYTIISAEDVQARKWKAVNHQEESLDYVINLEKQGKKQLCIWPYHCIEGSFGHALEGQFTNMIYFHSVARKANVKRIVKGLVPFTEMYGIFRPEYSKEDYHNRELLKEVASYDKIFIAGEAKSHCVLESVIQLLQYFEENQMSGEKIHILEDCTSSIPGFEDNTEKLFQELVGQYGIQIVQSTDF